ncbi:MAG: transposase [Alphaproteobacteria bacterium]|nr:transposase [Alphaproteobacteria bacterium]
MNLKKRYDQEFKLNTVQLILSGKSTLSAVSRDLGVSKSSLHDWMKEYKPNEGKEFIKSENSAFRSQDMRQLKRENEILRQERDILKKALGIFSSVRK